MNNAALLQGQFVCERGVKMIIQIVAIFVNKLHMYTHLSLKLNK